MPAMPNQQSRSVSNSTCTPRQCGLLATIKRISRLPFTRCLAVFCLQSADANPISTVLLTFWMPTQPIRAANSRMKRPEPKIGFFQLLSTPSMTKWHFLPWWQANMIQSPESGVSCHERGVTSCIRFQLTNTSKDIVGSFVSRFPAFKQKKTHTNYKTQYLLHSANHDTSWLEAHWQTAIIVMIENSESFYVTIADIAQVLSSKFFVKKQGITLIKFWYRLWTTIARKKGCYSEIRLNSLHTRFLPTKTRN